MLVIKMRRILSIFILIIMVGFTVQCGLPQQREVRGYMPAPAAVTVVIGDSITLGDGYGGGWCTRMGYTNKGVGGETSMGAKARFDTDVVALAPDNVIIALGVAHIYLGYSVSQFNTDVQWMIDEANLNSITPYLITTTRRRDGVEQFDAVNAAMRTLCTNNSIECLDLYASQTSVDLESTTYMADNYHPNDAGYDLIASWLTALDAPAPDPYLGYSVQGTGLTRNRL